MEGQIISEFNRHSAAFFRYRSEYDTVHVLLLYWRDGDLKVEQELTALRTLFGNDLNFLVASYPIPGDGTQQARLNKEIASLVEESALRPRTLIIIYYTGHCRDAEGKAEWAAQREGGPTLIWSDIQTCLFSAIGDVLLILDCCHATLISKGRKKHGRFEIIAACAKGLETPVPGEESFTGALLRAFSSDVLRGGTTARGLRAIIEGFSRETPFWDSPSSDATPSIPIKRLDSPSFPGFISKPTGYVFLRASLLDDLDGLQISDWLKANAPKNITAVHIEAIVLKARRLQKNLDHDAFPQNSILRKLSPSAQAEVLKELQSLDTVMATSVRNAQNPLLKDDGDTICNTLDAIQASASAVNISIETPVLLDMKKEDLGRAMNDEKNMPSSDALVSISLRNRVLEERESASSVEIPRNEINFPNSGDRFRIGQMQEQNIILEFFEYEPDSDGQQYPGMVLQLEQMATLLCHSKRLSFHILPCLGYIHDQVNHHVGLAFQPPSKHNTSRSQPVTLLNVYTTHRRVPLGQRILLAYNLVTALENFHRVGWVHKEIRSDNICFLGPAPDADPDADGNNGDIDLSSPWLFGFEYARAAEAGTKLEEDHSGFRNLYRHPQRWSRPTAKFKRSHDIYSLGIVLLEIASWKEVSQMASINPTRRIAPEQFREILLRKLTRDLPHQVGELFTSTVHTCFDFDTRTEGMSEFEMQKFFQKAIVGRIGKAVGRV